MIQRLYRFIFWTGYLAVLLSSIVPIIGNLDKVKLGHGIFIIRLDHLLHVSVYFLICMYYLVGYKKGFILFKKKSLIKFTILILSLGAITEIVQLWVPARSFNVMDIVANLFGFALGILIIMITYPVFRKVNSE